MALAAVAAHRLGMAETAESYVHELLDGSQWVALALHHKEDELLFGRAVRCCMG